ncbi:hypothetical protein [Streptosporangium sp. NPDC006007]|uniref:hypothetical protein n=1 Tax=Streptosporangium sp. NPDC006007 TaxID=3154575 RepID=UPI0033BEE58D
MTTPFVGEVDPVDAAEELREALAKHQIAAGVHHGYGLALVSIWAGINVWCYGQRFWWRVGWDQQRQQVVYNWHPAADSARAARRIAFHYAALRRQHVRSRENAS